MKQIVIMPGGFHPFHAGHASLYHSAVKAFPDADVYVAATNDTKTRPFPFTIKEKLAKLAGVAPGKFIQVKSPFQPREITDHFDPEQDVVIFVRSEKDRNESPKPGGTKKDGSPSYFQPWTGKNVQPFSKHEYIAYLPTVEFGPGITSATEIRKAWPTLDDRRKTAMVMSLYPATQKNPKLAANVVKMLDMGMGNELAEGWKDAVAGGAMALGALGAGAQTMPDINVQQVELANKYYNVLVQRAKEDGIKLDTRTLNVIKAKAQDAAAKKTQQSTPQQGFPSQGSERKVSKDASKFESEGVAEASPNQQMALYKPDGKTYRGEKMPTLDNPNDIYNRSQSYEIDSIEDEPTDEPNLDASIKELIKNKLDELEPRERKILQLRYWHDMTLREIADRIGVNPARIAQIEAKAMRKIKQATLNNKPELLKMYVPESIDYLEEK